MDLFWKIKSKIRKITIAHSSDPHPSSYPFISGDTFVTLADHLYDTSSKFDPLAVKKNDIVFVQSDVMDRYFQKIHPIITKPYILITHNGDRNISDKELLFIDDKIVHWFAQNVLVRHPKLTPLPIGIENANLANAGYLPFYTHYKPTETERISKILIGFNIASNYTDRKKVYEILRADPKSVILKNRLSQPKYVQMVKKYCFIASPPGNGEDCIRTWEAMLLGTIPIVQRSVGIEYFKSLNLPLMIVDSWDELIRSTEDDLRKKYDSIMSQADRSPLYMDYYINLIELKTNE